VGGNQKRYHFGSVVGTSYSVAGRGDLGAELRESRIQQFVDVPSHGGMSPVLLHRSRVAG
ncbi:MAG: hypothetical protein ABGX22_10830, partial [Pirellulaceae bacterium]